LWCTSLLKHTILKICVLAEVLAVYSELSVAFINRLQSYLPIIYCISLRDGSTPSKSEGLTLTGGLSYN